MDSDTQSDGLTILGLCDVLQDILAKAEFEDLPVWDIYADCPITVVSLIAGKVYLG